MASKTDVMNRALTKLGDSRITSPTDDDEKAIVLNNMFDTLRDAELRSHNWNFAIKRAQIAALVSTPSFGFTYEYQLPGDCLRVLMIDDRYVGYSLASYRTLPEQDYQIEGRKILTNIGAPLKIKYVYSVTNVGDWDPVFVEYFACSLAFEAAEKLAQGGSRKDRLGQDRRDALLVALRADAIENPPELIADDSWIMSRL